MTEADCAWMRTALGAYAVGALSPAERAGVDRHLSTCPACRRERRELTDLVDLLALVPAERAAADPAGGDEPGLIALLGRVRRERRARQRTRLLAAAAASTLVLVATAYLTQRASDDLGSTRISAGGPAQPAPSAPVLPLPRTVRGSDPDTGVSATVTLSEVGWGSKVRLLLSGVSGPRTCRLVVIGRHGERQVASTWSVPAGGYGAASGGAKATPATLDVTGAVALAPSEVARLQVITASGQRLVSLGG